MRKELGEFMESSDYLLHADMWNLKKFPTKANVINCGLGESNLLNIAGGLASQGKTVYVYGVAGFIIHRFEQLKFSCKHFGAKKGKIIICNAGKYGYDKLGIGHSLDDDEPLMWSLNVPFFEAANLSSLKHILGIIKNKDNGMYYIQLGREK